MGGRFLLVSDWVLCSGYCLKFVGNMKEFGVVPGVAASLPHVFNSSVSMWPVMVQMYSINILKVKRWSLR